MRFSQASSFGQPFTFVLLRYSYLCQQDVNAGGGLFYGVRKVLRVTNEITFERIRNFGVVVVFFGFETFDCYVTRSGGRVFGFFGGTYRQVVIS